MWKLELCLRDLHEGVDSCVLGGGVPLAAAPPGDVLLPLVEEPGPPGLNTTVTIIMTIIMSTTVTMTS